MDFVPLPKSCLWETCSWSAVAQNHEDTEILLCANKDVTGETFMIADRSECDKYEQASDSSPWKFYTY